MTYLAVFVAIFLLDFVWARYNAATSHGTAFVAANYSAVIIVLSAFGVTQYATDPVMIIPGAAGAWCGTYLAVWWKPGTPPAQ